MTGWPHVGGGSDEEIKQWDVARSNFLAPGDHSLIMDPCLFHSKVVSFGPATQTWSNLSLPLPIHAFKDKTSGILGWVFLSYC